MPVMGVNVMLVVNQDEKRITCSTEVDRIKVNQTSSNARVDIRRLDDGPTKREETKTIRSPAGNRIVGAESLRWQEQI